MSVDHKDRFGDKLRDKEKGEEERYFAERERELIERLKRAREGGQAETPGSEVEMRCPRCASPLEEERHDRVTVDRCPSCGGVWLDKNELEAIVERGKEGWLRRLLTRAR